MRADPRRLNDVLAILDPALRLAAWEELRPTFAHSPVFWHNFADDLAAAGRADDALAAVLRAIALSPGLAQKLSPRLQDLVRTRAPAPAVPRPSRAGDYELERAWAESATQVLYDAHEERKGSVTVRVVPDLSADAAFELFHREREAARALPPSYTSVPRVRDLLRERDGAYEVLERVGGQTVAQLRAAGAPTRSRTLELVRRIALAVAELHAAGAVHADLRPDHVLLDGDRVLLLGLAAGAQGSLLRTYSFADARLRWLAPERCRGDVVDARADVYALGLLWLYLIAGDVPPLADRIDGHEVRGAGDPACEKLLARCLRADPSERDLTADKLARALEAMDVPPATPAGTMRLAPPPNPAADAVPAPNERPPMRVKRLSLPPPPWWLAIVLMLLSIGSGIVFARRSVSAARAADACREAIARGDWGVAMGECRAAARYDGSFAAQADRATQEKGAQEMSGEFERLLPSNPRGAAEVFSSIPPDTRGEAAAQVARTRYLAQHRTAANAATRSPAPERCAMVKKELALIEPLEPLNVADHQLQSEACPSPPAPRAADKVHAIAHPIPRVKTVAAGHGWITVASDPPDAQVYFEDEPRCRTKPICMFEHLATGQYALEIRKDGYKPLSTRVFVMDGRETPFRGSLKLCPPRPASCDD